jgi:hypothetical protein
VLATSRLACLEALNPFESVLYDTLTGYPPVAAAATKFLLIVQKMRQALTFLATIENDDPGMKTLAVISILALLTISGAAYTDRILSGDRQATQEAN